VQERIDPQSFQTRLKELFRAVQVNPMDKEARAGLQGWLDEHPDEFEAWLPADALTFGTAPERKSRRLDFLKHLLLSGYLPPRVETVSGAAWQHDTVNFAVVPSYFYSNTFSFLEAGFGRTDVAVFVAQPHSSASQPWVELRQGSGLNIHAALMLDSDGRNLVWRHFQHSVAAHYLFPVDNYHRDKFRLVKEYANCGVPMPGSALLRDVCEDKAQLQAIVKGIPGLHLPGERLLLSSQDSVARASIVDNFCQTHNARHLVTKPVDGFGGYGVQFWDYPHERPAMLAHLASAFASSPAIVLQERIRTLPVRSGREWNVRQYVVRRSATEIVAPYSRIRIGTGVINTEQGADSFLVDSLLAELDLTVKQRAGFEAAFASIDSLGIQVMNALTNYMQRKFQPQESGYRGGGSNLEADLLALDFMIAPDNQRPDRYRVYLLEINDFASGGMRDFEILIHRQRLPQASSIHASQPYCLAPAILDTARWRGQAYKNAIEGSGSFALDIANAHEVR